MPRFHHGHGGRRKGSGRKQKSQTLGPPQANALTRYFQTPDRQPRTNTNPSTPSNNILAFEEPNNPTTPRTQNLTTPTIPVAAETTNTLRLTNGDGVENVTQIPRNVRDDNHPNYNAEEMIDETIFMSGKKISSSKNLRLQREIMKSPAFYANAYANIEKEGHCWMYPPTVMKNPSHNIKERWLDFFRLRIFSWIPEAIISDSWRPNCPNCKVPLSRNGHSVDPKMVFDLHDNYWLYAPNKYICRDCELKYKDKVLPENKSYSFRSTSKEIMEQIKHMYPETYDLFPCFMTQRNAIDKKLLEITIHSAVKGIGPSALRESIVSLHELNWQQKENAWARHMVEELNNAFRHNGLDRSTIEKCPEYFSSKLGGCVPSGTWMVDTFCSYLAQKRSYFDSECIRRAQTTKILAIDASYKVPKWMMKWGSDRIYDALHSGTNEYNEIVVQRFSTSDNHEELGNNLEQLHSLGLNPHLTFSDDPLRDESLLKKHFPLLKNHDDDIMEEDDEVPEDLVEMSTQKHILYLHILQDTLDSLSRF